MRLRKSKNLTRKQELEETIKRNEEALRKLGAWEIDIELDTIDIEKEKVETYIQELSWRQRVLKEDVTKRLLNAHDKLEKAKEYARKRELHFSERKELEKQASEALNELNELLEIEKLIPFLAHAYQHLEGDSARYLEEAMLNNEGFIVSPHRDRLKETQCGGFFIWSKDVNKEVLNRTKAMREQAKKGNFESVKGMFLKPLSLGFLGDQHCEACGRGIIGIQVSEEEGGLIFNPKLFVEFMKFLLES